LAPDIIERLKASA